MKKVVCKPFGTRYEYFIEHLVNCYISKMSGAEIVKAELQEWEEEAQQVINNELERRIRMTLG